MKYYNPKKLKFFLLSLTVITIGIILSIFISHRIFDKKNETISDINNKADVSLHKVHQSATRDGLKEWSLDATKVNYITEKKQANFQDLSVIFYLKDNTEVYLTADQGILKTYSNDIEAKGNVVMIHGQYRLKTEELHYKNNDHIISSKVPVKITGDSLVLVADSMSLDLNTKQTLFEGKVEGTLVDKIIF